MRWITFFLLLYLAAALDLARFGSLSPAGQHYPSIQYVSMLAIFYALYASEQAAPLAALVAGMILDVLNAEPFGVYTISLGIVAWAITKIRLSIFREHMVSQLIVVLLAICSIGLLSATLRDASLYWLGATLAATSGGGGEGNGNQGAVFAQAMTAVTVNALYTGLLAPAFFWLLFRFQNLLGFDMKTGRKR